MTPALTSTARCVCGNLTIAAAVFTLDYSKLQISGVQHDSIGPQRRSPAGANQKNNRTYALPFDISLDKSTTKE